MPLISSPLTDMLIAHMWHEQDDGTWSRDGCQPVSTAHALAIEEREAAEREMLLLRDPRKGKGTTPHVVAHFDAATGERVGTKRHETTEAERLYEVGGHVVAPDGTLVRAPRLVGR